MYIDPEDEEDHSDDDRDDWKDRFNEGLRFASLADVEEVGGGGTDDEWETYYIADQYARQG
ncbi:hypothetical protein A2716_00360 [candidate division WWE3 bacterium RIFCSPHIGHO2_01_FULL_40_23]|uniref:Uncharacterized protein n=1 Tax=candidate division WWE3 bacterium RIFCSPLOWO2_01_FULL_41_18 TaxID=1802625 RepID=A0A1F4VE49_UNCKA|nr:MAG: hypothetical protein A2716_00360 [candidate division WWE3 bacterium RIFCSPHIGHO2_01_FULL_40_23]OGC55449.1 MAG: hypothetical protein A3A78_00630 [candidate division WWE3 bacterium RIFCSPLOWO2_01_FULL_41_18]